MGYCVEHLNSSDYTEIIEYLNNVFSETNGREMNFKKSFPRVFKELDENMSWHYAVKENGKICGTAASYPLTYSVGEEVLHLAACGNVAVSSDYRNQGIMQLLMNQLVKELPEKGFDIAYLHGYRTRYRTFGFERCGVEYIFQFNKPKQFENKFSFSDLREESSDTIDFIQSVARNQKSGILRKNEDLIDALCAQMRTPYVIKNKNNEIVGSFSASINNKQITELCLTDSNLFNQVIQSFLVSFNLDQVFMGIPAFEYEFVTSAMELADRYQIVQPGNFLILNFEKIVRTFLKAKSKYTYLAEGTMIIDSEIFGKWKISYFDGTVTVEKTEEPAQIVFPGYTVYPFIFGTASPINVDKSIAVLASSWFPLPLYCPYLS